jgi:hypothetical protein
MSERTTASFRRLCASRWSPLALVIASPDAEALCSASGLSVVDLLAPHCTSQPNGAPTESWTRSSAAEPSPQRSDGHLLSLTRGSSAHPHERRSLPAARVHAACGVHARLRASDERGAHSQSLSLLPLRPRRPLKPLCPPRCRIGTASSRLFPPAASWAAARARRLQPSATACCRRSASPTLRRWTTLWRASWCSPAA